MATKKAPSKAQLAARKKFIEMVRAKSKAKKSATKKKSGTKKKATKLPSLFDKSTSRQTGTSNKVKDAKRKALAPGKRKSATGKSYTERRANRSDKPGSLTGITVNKYAMIALKDSLERLAAAEKNLSNVKNTLASKTFSYNKVYTAKLKKDSISYLQLIKDIKKHITQLKKHIK